MASVVATSPCYTASLGITLPTPSVSAINITLYNINTASYRRCHIKLALLPPCRRTGQRLVPGLEHYLGG
eukprot:742703-Pyramimonas_sp.AAC.2